LDTLCSRIRVRLPSTRVLVAILVLGGCAHGAHAPAWRQDPGVAEARGYYYTDSNGLAVTTVGVQDDQPVAPAMHVSLRGVLDDVNVSAHQIGVMGGANSVDTVTSASSTLTSHKQRLEGIGAFAWDHAVHGAPSTFGVQGRVSHEKDYASLSGLLTAQTSLAQQNTTLGAFAGYGKDTIDPVAAPVGQQMLWPASHDRVTAGGTMSQVLSPAMVLSAGIGTTRQRGRLSSPYRNAQVGITLYPETHPDARDRYTAFVGLSWHIGWETAVHVRQGAYTDTWGVRAIIPEVSIATSIAERVLLTLRLREYQQWAASFYEPTYDKVRLYMSGDPRLGRVEEHLAGLDARWTVRSGAQDFGSITIFAGYELSFLTFDQLHQGTLTAHVVTLGVTGSY
jgi:hypothetical protein